MRNPLFQVGSYSEVPGVRPWAYIFGVLCNPLGAAFLKSSGSTPFPCRLYPKLLSLGCCPSGLPLGCGRVLGAAPAFLPGRGLCSPSLPVPCRFITSPPPLPCGPPHLSPPSQCSLCRHHREASPVTIYIMSRADHPPDQRKRQVGHAWNFIRNISLKK